MSSACDLLYFKVPSRRLHVRTDFLCQDYFKEIHKISGATDADFFLLKSILLLSAPVSL